MSPHPLARAAATAPRSPTRRGAAAAGGSASRRRDLERDQRAEAVPEQVARPAVGLGRRRGSRRWRPSINSSMVGAGSAARCSRPGRQTARICASSPSAGLPVQEHPQVAARVREAEDARRGARAAGVAVRNHVRGSWSLPDRHVDAEGLGGAASDGSPGRMCSSPRSGSMTTAATVRSRRMSPVSATQIGGARQHREVLLDVGPGRPAATARAAGHAGLQPEQRGVAREHVQLVARGRSPGAGSGWCARGSRLDQPQLVAQDLHARGRSPGRTGSASASWPAAARGRMASASSTLAALSSRCRMARYGGRPGRQSPPSTRFRPIARPSLFIPR